MTGTRQTFLRPASSKLGRQEGSDKELVIKRLATVLLALVAVSIALGVTPVAAQNRPQSGRLIVTVSDTTKPVITLIGSATPTVECHSSYTELGASVSDACDTGLTLVTVGGQTVNVNTPGTYVVTYSITDASGTAALSAQLLPGGSIKVAIKGTIDY